MKDSQHNIAQQGGKAARLARLREWGFAVPEFVVIAPGESGFQLRLSEFLQAFPDHTFAVRSSATAEDSEEKSFAGQFQTFLNVKAKEVLQKIEAVKASVEKEHLQRYTGRENKFKMAVVVQRMVPAEVSGVVFGADPISGDDKITVISAAWGVGEGLVSGDQDADTYSFRSAKWHKEVREKNRQTVLAESGTRVVPVPEDRATEPCLQPSHLKELKELSDQLTRKFGQPQDIEFCLEGGKIWLLQSRPITTLKKGDHHIWDNSNIIESYPGITSPLTFSFIIRMYKAVYEQLSEILGVPRYKIVRNEAVYERMLALLNGRVYYNLINWYRVLAMVPGFSLNARYMEKMMGTGVSYELPEEERDSKWKTRWQFFISIGKMLWAYKKLKAETRSFRHYFNAVMSRFEQMDFDRMKAREIKEKIKEYENVLLKKWHAPLVNDFFAMIFFGMFEKMLGKWYRGSQEAIHNDLLIGSQDIVSARPVQLLAEIDVLIRKDEQAMKLFAKSASAVWKQLPKYPAVHIKVKQYLHEFGDRNVGELKLETITYRQQPQQLINRIKKNLEQGQPLKRGSSEGQRKRKEAEREVFGHIKSSVKKAVLRFVLKRTRYLVSNRENLRYERTRAFGMVRRMFLKLGEKLQKEKQLTEARDIFYLKEGEIFEWLEAASVTTNLQHLIDLRKKEYAGFEKEAPLKERIETYGLVYPQLAVHHEKESTGGGLKGLACCAGVVEAEVRVIHVPEEAGSLNGEILVTASTDPGWITLFYGASGILVERGSLLSHSAIVSREMDIPCIVSVRGLLSSLRSGDRVRMNGATGEIEILERAAFEDGGAKNPGDQKAGGV